MGFFLPFSSGLGRIYSFLAHANFAIPAMAFNNRPFAAIPLGNSISRPGHVIPVHRRSHEKAKLCFRVRGSALHCDGCRMSATALHGTGMETLDYRRLPFSKYGIAQLVSSQCTLNQAQHLFSQGVISKRELARYVRIWESSAYRTTSKVQDGRYATGGQAAVERRYSRAMKLHAAWRKQVLISIARDCLARLGK